MEEIRREVICVNKSINMELFSPSVENWKVRISDTF